MNEWLTARIDGPAVLVTVAIVEGSGPREPGAKMLVTAAGQIDTIGGGHLELCAVEMARAMLKEGCAAQTGAPKTAPHAVDASAGTRDGAAAARLERYALGPTLGQCCGGVVYLAFELVDDALRSVLESLRERRREDSWRLSAIDGSPAAFLLDSAGAIVGGASAKTVAAHSAGKGASAPAVDRKRGTHILKGADGRRWLADPCLAPRAHLLLFGAGHVGAAIVRMLGELPCTVTWIDERDDMFPSTIPSNVTVEATDMPEALVASAPADASYLVMTHSHALDQRLSEAILARADAGWFGLIGSKTKRVQFERRMAARGLPQDRIDAMVCPIGLAGITNKLPAAIAASVCAQLLMVWEARQIAALERDARPPLFHVGRISAA
jgi:xanthine dehydrogenase accessory factor